MEKALERIYDLAEELEATMLLEYHNMNHLAHGTNPKRLNEEQRRIVRLMKSQIEKLNNRP